MASTADGVYVIGGEIYGLPKRIDEYRNGSWRNAGQLREARLSHSVIILSDRLFIIGGSTYINGQNSFGGLRG